jgi:hypothetical protein
VFELRGNTILDIETDAVDLSAYPTAKGVVRSQVPENPPSAVEVDVSRSEGCVLLDWARLKDSYGDFAALYRAFLFGHPEDFSTVCSAILDGIFQRICAISFNRDLMAMRTTDVVFVVEFDVNWVKTVHEIVWNGIPQRLGYSFGCHCM